MAVALYARVSTTRQAEQDLSIPDQLRQMREWCAKTQNLIAREYIEPGASATDDRRPIFQQMIADAMLTPPPFEAIVVHSLSRFFRDVISFGMYERQLAKHDVKVISITQQTAEDSSGELARRIFSAFDEYQSKENAKHTARAMRENARQGFFNGSGAPFGYCATATEALGNRGRRKRKLLIDEVEAAVVRRIYELYLQGFNGRSLGFKEIAKLLNSQGQTMRGRPWGIQKIHKILSSATYRGEHYYNVIDSRHGKKRPPSEWIAVAVPPIVNGEIFERARQRREGRRPSAVPPRRLTSPTLLTGLLKCDHCGASMTLVTGKSGKYRYYKCTSRVNKGNAQCVSRNLPTDKLDEIVLTHLAERVFTPERLLSMVNEARHALRKKDGTDRGQLAHLQNKLHQADARLNRLYEVVEGGMLPLDETLQRRVQQAKAARESLLIEMAGLRRRQMLPIDRILPSQIQNLSKLLRKKLRDRSSGFGKSYLHAVVDEVRVHENTATIRGSHDRLMALAAGKAAADQVPSSIPNWRGRRDSNPRPQRS